MKWQIATVTSVIKETASVVTIELDAPDWPGHRAGQHLEVWLTAEDGYCADRSAPARRAFAQKPSAVGSTVEKVIEPICLACVTDA